MLCTKNIIQQMFQKTCKNGGQRVDATIAKHPAGFLGKREGVLLGKLHLCYL